MNRYTLFRRLCLGLSALCAAGLLYRRFRGILLAFLGAPCFLAILLKGKGGKANA